MAAAVAVTVAAHLSTPLSRSVRDACPVISASLRPISRLSLTSPSGRFGAASAPGFPLFAVRSRSRVMNTSFSIRSEQSSKEGNSLDVWIGRVAMIGFALAITVEVSTGKGLIENFGLASPLPTAALAVMGLVGGVTAVYIFQTSASKS
ncbi:Stress enhanced protein 1, chloroplastic [Linum grandiflorum]